MKKLIKKTKNKLVKALSRGNAFWPAYFFGARYFWYRDHLMLEDKTLLVKCNADTGYTGIVKGLLKELEDNEKYNGYTLYLSGKQISENEGAACNNVKFVKENSLRYRRVLATAKYLICEESPGTYFAKREGQIYVNIRYDSLSEKTDVDYEKISNGQKGLFDSDYLLCQSEEDANRLVKEFMLENFAKAKIWIPQGECEENPAKLICRRLLLNEKNLPLQEQDIPYNGKKNVLIYLGGLGKNGLTTSGVNLLNQLDRTKNNYTVFCSGSIVSLNPENIRVIPEGIPFIFYRDYRCLTFRELLIYILWRGLGIVSFEKAKSVVTHMGKRNAERMLSNCRMDTSVHFTGYNDDMIATMAQLPGKRVIFVHSDMEKEIRYRGNVNKDLLGYAYKVYDSVAVVTKEMIPPAQRIAQGNANFILCRNVIDTNRIVTLGQLPLEFDQSTAFYENKDRLLEMLDSGKKKFVSVGRFSVEKGHDRLVRAFERVHRIQKDTCLVIIGGSGDLWEKTIRLVEESSCPDAVFLVRDMSNPFPLIKQCDCLVLSSLYEGFGLVLAEADVLGVSCFTVDIDGPRSFMQTYGGRIVENSEEGIYEGMLDALKTDGLHILSVDYETYNKKAVAEFEGLL